MTDRHPQDPAYDPQYRQLIIRLECLPTDSKSFAVTRAQDGGYVVWCYDPTNRITSPCLATFSCLAELVAQLVASLLGNHDDDPRIFEVLRQATEWARLYRLEFHAKALAEGGHTCKDPRLGPSPQRDRERAALLAEYARTVRDRLEESWPTAG